MGFHMRAVTDNTHSILGSSVFDFAGWLLRQREREHVCVFVLVWMCARARVSVSMRARNYNTGPQVYGGARCPALQR